MDAKRNAIARSLGLVGNDDTALGDLVPEQAVDVLDGYPPAVQAAALRHREWGNLRVTADRMPAETFEALVVLKIARLCDELSQRPGVR